MPKTIDFEAKNTEEALDQAVKQTGITLSELKFTILSQGGAGIFGLSLRKAKIRVELPEPEPPVATPVPEASPEPIETLKPAVEEAPAPQEEAAPRGLWARPSHVSAEAPAKKLKKVTIDDIIRPPVPPGRIDLDLSGGESEAAAPSRERSDSRRRSGDRERPSERRDRGRGRRTETADRPPRSERPERPERDRRTEAPAREALEIKIDDQEPAVVQEPPEGFTQEQLDKARDVVVEMLRHLAPEAKVETGWREDKIYVNILGDGSGILIGRKGRNLEAIQYLVSKIMDKLVGEHVRVMVDTESYRVRREQELRQKARELAEWVLRTGEAAFTVPLNPQERRVIHLALLPEKRLKTASRGEGTFKKVIISLAKDEPAPATEELPPEVLETDEAEE